MGPHGNIPERVWSLTGRRTLLWGMGEGAVLAPTLGHHRPLGSGVPGMHGGQGRQVLTLGHPRCHCMSQKI